jgi:hypothetical protein
MLVAYYILAAIFRCAVCVVALECKQDLVLFACIFRTCALHTARAAASRRRVCISVIADRYATLVAGRLCGVFLVRARGTLGTDRLSGLVLGRARGTLGALGLQRLRAVSASSAVVANGLSCLHLVLSRAAPIAGSSTNTRICACLTQRARSLAACRILACFAMSAIISTNTGIRSGCT